MARKVWLVEEPMQNAIVSQCIGIANEVEALEAELSTIQQELVTASPSMKPLLVREIRRINVELSRARQQLLLYQIQNPPGPRPDLLALSIVLHINRATKRVGVAALIKNIGVGDAFGPFYIEMSVALWQGRSSVYNLVRSFEVPAGVIISGRPVLTEIQQPQQAAFTTTLGPGFPPSQLYLTEDIIIAPLQYYDETPSTTYEIEYHVDINRQVTEQNDGNNVLSTDWRINKLGTTLSTMAFTIDAESGEVVRESEYEELTMHGPPA
jgi:hypothetical protein